MHKKKIFYNCFIKTFISSDEATNKKFRCNPDNIQRLSFYKLTYKDVDDDIIGNILIFSDYKK